MNENTGEVRPKPMPRYCYWCGHVCYEGYHDASGRFVTESVVVTDAEVMLAHYRAGQKTRDYARTRRNVSFGIHIGVYHPEGWPDEKPPRGPMAPGAVREF